MEGGAWILAWVVITTRYVCPGVLCRSWSYLTLCIPLLMSRSPAYHRGHLHRWDSIYSIFSLGNWRALHHHAACWLVNIHITWHFCPPVSMVKDAMESVYWVIGIVVYSHERVSIKAPTCWFCHSLPYFTYCKRATRCDILHPMHTFACVQLAEEW